MHPRLRLSAEHRFAGKPRGAAHWLSLAATLAMVITVVPALGFNASREPDPSAVKGAAVQQTPVNNGSAVEIPLDPVLIEAEPLNPQPTLEQLMQRFRETLAKPPSFLLTEHSLGSSGVEVRSRFGRFCINPLPATLSGGPGGDVTVAARCAAF